MRVFVINEFGCSILEEGAQRDDSEEGPSLHHFGDILTLCLSAPNTKTYQRSAKWSNFQSDLSQVGSLNKLTLTRKNLSR